MCEMAEKTFAALLPSECGAPGSLSWTPLSWSCWADSPVVVKIQLVQ